MFATGLAACSSAPKTDRDRVDGAIRSHRDDARHCYEDALVRMPGVEGKLVLAWVIQLNGQATDIKVAESSLKEPMLEKCIAGVIAKIRFPEQTIPTTVKYPFVFQGTP